MNLVDRHSLSSELQSEMYSDLESVGENNQLTCLEEVQTAVWFIFWFIYCLTLLIVKLNDT